MADCSIPCNLCSGTDVDEVSTRARDGSFLRTVICRRCGLLWTDPRPLREEINHYYARQYRLDYKSTYQPKAFHLYRGGTVAIGRWAGLRDYLKPGSRVLDFGAGAGEFVYVLRRLGCDAMGIEPNEGYARFARETLGVPVTQGFYQKSRVPSESCDVVTLFHVLEHLEDPFHALSSVGGWLKPGGFLVVEVPNAEAVCQWPSHRFHRAHLYSFNPAALARLVEKSGCEVRGTSVSEDGGNVTVIGEKSGQPAGTCPAGIAGNFERVVSILRAHTNLRHIMSGFPLKRLVSKLRQRSIEFHHTRGRLPSPDLLDEIIRQAAGGTESGGRD